VRPSRRLDYGQPYLNIPKRDIIQSFPRGGCATMIDVTCPQCGEVYHADPVHLGKRIRCTKCGSLLPILGGGGTIIQNPPEANGVRQYQHRSEHRGAHPSPGRNAIGLGFAVVVAVIAVGLIILWRYRNTHESTNPALSARTRESQTSSFTGGATPVPSVNSDGLSVLGEIPLGTGSDDLPCSQQEPTNYRSMPNGSRIMPDVGTTGYGVLEVQNGTAEDAAVSLYDSATDEMVREVYIQARHSVRVKGIPKGTYELAYTKGLDWDNGGAIFRCGDPDYAQFARTFAFTEERDQERIRYRAITVTLHAVVGGNVRTRRISRQEFLRRNHRTAALSR
jgi:phage FluMu protein Com